MKINIQNKKIRFTLIFALIIVLIIAFRIYSNIAENRDRAARVSAKDEMVVETAIVKRQNIIPTLTFSANLEPIWSADISPKNDGRIDKLYVNEGDYVQKGQILAQLDTEELAAQVYQARGSLFAADAQRRNATLDYERSQKLYDQNAISKKELDNALYNKKNTAGISNEAKGALKLLEERLDNASIKAPQNAVVAKRYMYAGQYAKSGTAIITLADTTTLLATANISEGYIGEISIGADVDIKVVAYKDDVFKGKISRISPVADLPARTFKVEITIPNNDNKLRAGMLSDISIKANERKNAIVIPQEAIVMREDQKTVYIINNENVVQQMLLEIGAIDNGMVEILKGLSEGDIIVTGGQNRLKQGVKVELASTENDSGKDI